MIKYIYKSVIEVQKPIRFLTSTVTQRYLSLSIKLSPSNQHRRKKAIPSGAPASNHQIPRNDDKEGRLSADIFFAISIFQPGLFFIHRNRHVLPVLPLNPATGRTDPEKTVPFHTARHKEHLDHNRRQQLQELAPIQVSSLPRVWHYEHSRRHDYEHLPLRYRCFSSSLLHTAATGVHRS